MLHVRSPRLWFSRRRSTSRTPRPSARRRAPSDRRRRLRERERGERRDLADGRHLDAVDRDGCPARARRCGRPGRRTTRAPSSLPHGRAPCTGRVARVPGPYLASRVVGADAQRRLDRVAAELVGEDHARERRRHLRARERRDVRGGLPPKWSRIASRSADAMPGRSTLRLPRAPRARTPAENATSRSPVRRDSAATSVASSFVFPSRQSVPAGSVAPTSSDGSSCVPASAGASQSEWSRVQSQVHATVGLSGSLPGGLNAAQPHDQTRRDVQLGRDLLRGERLPLDDVEPLPERLQALAAAGAGRRAERAASSRSGSWGSRSGSGPPCACASSPRRRRLPSDGALLRDRRAREVDLGHEVGDLRHLPPPLVRRFVVRVRPVRAAAGTAARRARRAAARSASTFARYCAVVGVHGVGSCAPTSSFSRSAAWSQPDEVTAVSNSLSARASIDDGSAGFDGVPTRLFR